MVWAAQTVIEFWTAAMAFFAFDSARLLEPGVIIALCLQVLLFLSSAFFSSSETALFSLNRIQLEQMRRAADPHSELIEEIRICR